MHKRVHPGLRAEHRAGDHLLLAQVSVDTLDGDGGAEVMRDQAAGAAGWAAAQVLDGHSHALFVMCSYLHVKLLKTLEVQTPQPATAPSVYVAPTELIMGRGFELQICRASGAQNREGLSAKSGIEIGCEEKK